MSVYQEVELFQMSDVEIVRMELEKTRTELKNLRKGLFARHDSLLKMYDSAMEEIERLKEIIERDGRPTIKPIYVERKEMEIIKSPSKPKCEMIFV